LRTVGSLASLRDARAEGAEQAEKLKRKRRTGWDKHLIPSAARDLP
jgi:hypothetical protein